jgi:hypothetical protein
VNTTYRNVNLLEMEWVSRPNRRAALKMRTEISGAQGGGFLYVPALSG